MSNSLLAEEGNLGTRTGVTRRPTIQPTLPARRLPTSPHPQHIDLCSPGVWGHQLAMLSGLHKSGTPEVLAQAAPDVWQQWVVSNTPHRRNVVLGCALASGHSRLLSVIPPVTASGHPLVTICLSCARCHGDRVSGLRGLQCGKPCYHVESVPGSIWTLRRASVWLINNVYDKKFNS